MAYIGGILGTHWVYIGVIFGICWGHIGIIGYILGVYKDNEKKMQPTIV